MTNWSTIAAGDDHTVALKAEGGLWAWGHNGYGQLGDATITDRYAPTLEATEATNLSAIATGKDHTVALKCDGTFWAWGYKSYRQIGDRNTDDKTPAQESTEGANWSTIVAGYYHTFAIKSDGTL